MTIPPVPGVDDNVPMTLIDDPILEIDDPVDINGQSLLPDEPDANDPTIADQPRELDRLLNEIQDITEDPTPILVAEIHAEIRRILRLHQEIYDGIELATDQVQDKRIEFLEAGPDVSVAELFTVFAMVFFLESPLVGIVLQRAFRFAAASARTKILTNRNLRLKRLRDDAGQIRQELIEFNKEEKLVRKTLKNNRTEMKQELEKINNKRRKRQALERQTPKAIKQAKVEAKNLLAFSELIKKDAAKEYGIGFTKAGVEAAKGAIDIKKVAATDTAVQNAFTSNTFGVQLKSFAQSFLRDVESFLGQVATDADMLRHIANNKYLRPLCVRLLQEMQLALSSDQQLPGEVNVINAKQLFMLEYEKLLWALLLHDRFFELPPQETIKKARTDGPLDNKGEQLRQANRNAVKKTDPPSILVEYLISRFFPNGKGLPPAIPFLDSSPPFLALRKVRDDFLAIARKENSIDVFKVIFKEGEESSEPDSKPDADTSTPSK
jgi:hypothetical protein